MASNIEKVDSGCTEDLDQIIYNFEHFQFPIDKFFTLLNNGSKEAVTNAVETFSKELCEEGNFSEEEIDKLKANALKIMELLVTVRGAELKNYFDANKIFDVGDHILLPDDKIQLEYSKENEEKVDQEIQELLNKQKLCLIMKNRIQEIDLLDKELSVALKNVEQ